MMSFFVCLFSLPTPFFCSTAPPCPHDNIEKRVRRVCADCTGHPPPQIKTRALAFVCVSSPPGLLCLCWICLFLKGHPETAVLCWPHACVRRHHGPSFVALILCVLSRNTFCFSRHHTHTYFLNFDTYLKCMVPLPYPLHLI